MIKGSRNQMGNLHNIYQTEAKRVLAVCSAGMLRSPTIANVLHKEYGYNTRSCGATDFALIPLSEALLVWADEVVVVSSEVLRYFSHEAYLIAEDKIVMLNLEDCFSWHEQELVSEVIRQYGEQNAQPQIS